jgi:hypothetical protein
MKAPSRQTATTSEPISRLWWICSETRAHCLPARAPRVMKVNVQTSAPAYAKTAKSAYLSLVAPASSAVTWRIPGKKYPPSRAQCPAEPRGEHEAEDPSEPVAHGNAARAPQKRSRQGRPDLEMAAVHEDAGKGQECLVGDRHADDPEHQ